MVDLAPVTALFFRENFTVSINTASAGPVQHPLGASGLIAEKATGIKGAVPTHVTAVKGFL